MSDRAIRVESLSKRYRIGGKKSDTALRDVLARMCSAPTRIFGKKASSDNGHPKHLWALHDVSFDVHQGEVVGIIGRNGSGKSTLLKILARVTKPTRGHAIVRGRMGALLEVGTGFHSELTGRENVFLSGAILGMRKTEIQRKFDEIVAFADVDAFIDTALKHYSSGMQMRLAFAVAAHLEPEILIVDEVLAVGDAEFQKKCIGKMGQVAKGGRTILFVSHNESAIRRLCSRAILLRDGQEIFDGSPEGAFQLYRDARGRGFSAANRIYSSNYLKITNGAILIDDVVTEELSPATEPVLNLTIEVLEEVTASFEVLLRDASSTPVMFGPIGLVKGFKHHFKPGSYLVSFQLKLPYLAEGRYSIDLMLVESGVRFFDYLEEALVLNILPPSNGKNGLQFKQAGGQGCILMDTSYPQITAISP